MKRLLLPATLVLLASSRPIHAAVGFSVIYSPDAFDGPFTGQVVVYLAAKGEPRLGPNWFAPEPMYSARFAGVEPGEPMLITDANAVGFPGRLSKLQPGRYVAQAVVDRNLGGRAIGTSPGNIYSSPVAIEVIADSDQVIELHCDKVVPQPTFKETQFVKEARIRSTLLSRHYGRDAYLCAAVVLPDEWFAQPDRKFPILYNIHGFGGSYLDLSGRTSNSGTNREGEPFIIVRLDANCPTGHSAFADSQNNGPWGKALTTELIPFIESKFRGICEAGARFVIGHSSGGWASLYLQVTYPDFFGGAWSLAPDPVDFRDFQGVDIYQPGANLFYDANGAPRPLARIGNRPVLFFKGFSDMERPIRGEQLGSFEAVFSPRAADGNPATLWNRDTGLIDPKVAEAWRNYDISYTLRTRWMDLAPKLSGKIHVYMGDMDTFFLDGAVRLLKRELAGLQAAATVELLPGDHSSVLTDALQKRIDAEIVAKYRLWKARDLAVRP